jgi:hypothetical protein
MAQAPTTWILTGSPENFAADAELLVDRMRAAAGVPA